MFTPIHLVFLLGIDLAVGALLLLILWPTKRSGPRVLRNWGVQAPTEEQGRVARVYLRQRRVLYAVFLVVGGPLGLDNGYVGVFLAALLLGELISMVRPVRGRTRVATLTRRGLSDVLPRWMIAVHIVAAVLSIAAMAVVFGARAGAVAQAWAWPWIPLFTTVGSVVAVYVVAWLAVARPAVGDPEVDAALRMRSARVMIGLGTMFAAVQFADALAVAAGLERQGNLAVPAWMTDVDVHAVGVVAVLLGLVAWGTMVSTKAFRTGLASARG